jgi:hypothetical protein
MVITYIPADPANYQGTNSINAIDRRRLAALIPYWEDLGIEVKRWQKNNESDLVYFVSLTQSVKLARQLILKKRKYAVVGGIIEDPFYADYAQCQSDDLFALKNHFIEKNCGLTGFLRKTKRFLAKSNLIRQSKVDLFKLVKTCDGVITTSEAQATMIRQLNINSSGIADCMPETDFNGCSINYNQNAPLNVVWEGTGDGLQLIELVRPALESAYQKSKIPFEFMLVSPNLRGTPLFGLYDNKTILSKHYKLPTKFVSWNLENLGNILSLASIGIAPMPLNNPFFLNKAYSKPLTYMACSIPVIASPIPSYKELIRDGIDGFLPSKINEWTNYLILLLESPELRKKIGEAGKKRLEQYHSVEIVAQKFADFFNKAIRFKREK